MHGNAGNRLHTGKEMVKMKRWIALLLTAVMTLSLAACGSNNETEQGGQGKDELLKNAVKISYEDLPNSSNRARAQQEIGNVYFISQTISEIGEDYCDLSPVEYQSTDAYGRDSYHIDRSMVVRAYLPTDTLAELNFGDEIAIVGKISDVTDVARNLQGEKDDSMCYEMEDAYITTEDEFDAANDS